MIKKFLKKIISADHRANLKRLRRKVGFLFQFNKKETSLADLDAALRGPLGIQAGDKVMVVSGFANLHASYSPQDVIDLLMKIVGTDGLLMMPYYPSGDMLELCQQNFVFDMKNTKSSMGVLTNVFSKMPGVVKSVHPLKAVCVWGKNAPDYIKGHSGSVYPFGAETPYGLLLAEDSKSLGLGVKNLPMFHAMEDQLLDEKNSPYLQDVSPMDVLLPDGERITCKTKIHDPDYKRSMPIGDFVAALNCSSYIRVPFGYSFLYSVKNREISAAYKRFLRKE